MSGTPLGLPDSYRVHPSPPGTGSDRYAQLGQSLPVSPRLAWKIDTPVRILAYTGPPPSAPLTQAQLAQPHTITPKALLNERSGRPTPARIHLFTPSLSHEPPGDIVRASLANYPIIPYRETLAGNKKIQTKLT